jgi:hypothetical protein
MRAKKTAAEIRKARTKTNATVANERASGLVCRVAYEILDEIICPITGIEAAWADVFMAEPCLYVSDKKKVAVEQRKKIITQVAKRYGGDVYAIAHAWRQPLALFALVAMSAAGYVSSAGTGKRTKKLTAKDAWAYLEHQDKRAAKTRRS